MMAGLAQQQAVPLRPGMDDVAEFVERAQAEIEGAIERGGLQRDQYRHPLRALSVVLGVFPAFVREMKAATAGPREPISSETMTELGRTSLILVEREVGNLIRYRLRTLLLYLALAVFVMAGTSFGLGWFMRGEGPRQTATGLRAASGFLKTVRTFRLAGPRERRLLTRYDRVRPVSMMSSTSRTWIPVTSVLKSFRMRTTPEDWVPAP